MQCGSGVMDEGSSSPFTRFLICFYTTGEIRRRLGFLRLSPRSGTDHWRCSALRSHFEGLAVRYSLRAGRKLPLRLSGAPKPCICCVSEPDGNNRASTQTRLSAYIAAVLMDFLIDNNPKSTYLGVVAFARRMGSHGMTAASRLAVASRSQPPSPLLPNALAPYMPAYDPCAACVRANSKPPALPRTWQP